MDEKTYIAIDLKSFYASVECVDRGLDPLDTNLVVADESRTEKTICLAVSPSLKAFGIPGRARLFEVVSRVREVNAERRQTAGRELSGSSVFASELGEKPSLRVDYITAKPRMAHYMEMSTRIINVYMKYVSPEDVHVYSIDEVFIDATAYLKTYGMSGRELAMTMIRDVLGETGITATAGVGTNLYLAKIAMDVMAKKMPADKNGVRIAELDEESYRRELWDHRPITDFWRVGRGYAARLAEKGLYTMGDVALCSAGGADDFYNEELLYDMFGVNAELLIDHAWGYEPCTMSEIKAYRPETSSLSSGQVLPEPYPNDKALLVVKEMADALALELVEKRLLTDLVVLDIGYDIENINDPGRRRAYRGPVTEDRYGRRIPKPAHGSRTLRQASSSSVLLMEKVAGLFTEITDEDLLIRRMNVTVGRLVSEDEAAHEEKYEQIELFTDYEAIEEERRAENEKAGRERKLQETMLAIRGRYGKNAILRGMNLQEGATAVDRNGRIGGHKAE